MFREIQKHFREKVMRVETQHNALSNCVFLVETEKGKFIVKDRSTGPEVRLCRFFGTPRILQENKDVLVQEYIEHSKIDFDRDWEGIAKALRVFHDTHVPFELGSQEELLVSFCTRLGYLDRKVTRVLERLCLEVGKIVGASSEQPGLCHNDLQPGNVLATEERVIFIDFEYASLGNQLTDVANLFCEAMCNYSTSEIDVRKTWAEEKKVMFLRTYFGDAELDCRALLARVTEMEAFSHLLWYLWGRECLGRGKRRNAEFSYHKYTESRMVFLKGLVSESDFSVLENDLKNVSCEESKI